MKYLILIADGMAGEPLAELGGRTTMETARKPAIDNILRSAKVGRVQNVPAGMSPGSDVATLSIFGYDPAKNISGRGPLEAAARGIDLREGICFRCNIVHIEQDVMVDFTAGHIATAKAAEIIKFLNEQTATPMAPKFYTGVSYRHLVVFNNDFFGQLRSVPPHDITGKHVVGYLPSGKNAALLNIIMYQLSQKIKKEFNDERLALWFWGGGGAPRLEPVSIQYGISGAIITAVDLLKGIGYYAGFEAINVPGATGFIDTNYEGKVQAALTALQQKDMVIVHIEAPDECGHMGNAQLKIKAIEDFDQKVVAPIFEAMRQQKEPFRILILPDHPTPIVRKTHSGDPVPFLYYDSEVMHRGREDTFCEYLVRDIPVMTGTELMPRLIKGDF